MVRPFVHRRPGPVALWRAVCVALRLHCDAGFQKLWSRALSATTSNDQEKRSRTALTQQQQLGPIEQVTPNAGKTRWRASRMDGLPRY